MPYYYNSCYCYCYFLLLPIILMKAINTTTASEPPPGEPSASVVAECTVVPKSAECNHFTPGSSDFVQCCYEQCRGRRMFTKPRVYTPMTQHGWWKNYTTDCLCCWDDATAGWNPPNRTLICILLVVLIGLLESYK